MDVLLSHPGKLLKDHLFYVCKIGKKRLTQVSPDLSLFSELDIGLELINKVVLITHDFGKANEFFQKKLWLAVNKPNCREYEMLKNDRRSSHGSLSAFYTYYILEQLTSNPLIPVVGFMIVNRHHGNLKNLKDNFDLGDTDFDILLEQDKTINKSILQEILGKANLKVKLDSFSILYLKEKFDNYRFRRRQLKKISEESNLNVFYLINLLYSILVFADKAEAIFAGDGYQQKEIDSLIFKRQQLSPDLVDKYRKEKKWDRPDNKFDELRNEVYYDVINNVDSFDLSNRILSINVPTGIGKTATSYSAALKLRDRLEDYYRIIYTLPFTSVIDQNYDIMKDILKLEYKHITSDYLIKHHYLTERSYESEDKDNISYNIAEFLIESWNSEIIISTFVQFMESILTNNNRRMKKYNSIANSIIIMDEVQTIPHKYWLLVKKILKDMADIFNCYFIFVTATMPLIFNEEKGEILELASKKGKYFETCDRIELDLSYIKDKMTLNKFKEVIRKDLNKEYPEKNFLFILNTIKSSIEVYKFIKDDLKYDNVIYLSKNIVNKDLSERIKKIKDCDQPLIVVSTQLVEAGVDIDFDRVYRDFAPLDSINQSCGRCNRNFNPAKHGKVKIFKLADENNKDKLYASYVYSDYLINMTKELFNRLPEKISEKGFFDLNKQYFLLVDAEKSNDQSNDLLDWIMSLQYYKAFENKDNERRFRLIDPKYETIDLFIPLNEEAEMLWKRYEKLKEIENPWDRKKLFEEFKEAFLGYIVTVSRNNALKHFEEADLGNSFNYVYPEEIENVYDIDTGFIQSEQIQYYV